ncbi:MAG: hypothetical protein WBE45_09000 [Terriglobales bacterium]
MDSLDAITDRHRQPYSQFTGGRNESTSTYSPTDSCFYRKLEAPEKPSAILAVEEVAHRSPPCFVQGLAFAGVYTGLGYGVGVFRFAARWAAVGEAWFIRL